MPRKALEIRDRVKELRRVKASELRKNPRNWREHPKAQRAAFRGALDELGFATAIIARETPDGLEIIDGHLRADESGNAKVPVLVLDVTKAEADKLLLTMDPLAGMAGANAETLESLLADCTFESAAVNEMLAEVSKAAGLQAEAVEIVEDEVPEPPADPVTKPGDLWLLGEHRLLCGDSTDPVDVGKLLGPRKPFLMVTDPPYGVDYEPDWRNEALKDGAKRRTGTVSNDHKVDWTEAYVLFPGHVAYVWHAGRYSPVLAQNLEAAEFTIRAQIIWSKPAFAISRGHYHWQHEPCWYAVRKGGSSKWCGDRSQSTIWQISNRVDQNDNTDHSTQKPVECMARPIRNHGEKDDDVYDPFLGSGTTLIAAEQLGRGCYGLELSPAYCDVIVTRWENLTGKRAVLET